MKRPVLVLALLSLTVTWLKIKRKLTENFIQVFMFYF